MVLYGSRIPWTAGVSWPSCVPSQHLDHPRQVHWGKQSGKWRSPWLCASTDQQQPKHWYVINTVLVTNAKYSTTGAAVKNVVSNSARSSTFWKETCIHISLHQKWSISLELSKYANGYRLIYLVASFCSEFLCHYAVTMTDMILYLCLRISTVSRTFYYTKVITALC